MADTATEWDFYPKKYEAYRKELSAELAGGSGFENFYGRLETKRLALDHLRRTKRFEYGFDLHQRNVEKESPQHDASPSLSTQPQVWSILYNLF